MQRLFNRRKNNILKGVDTHQRLKLDLSSTLYLKINSKWIKDLNIKAKSRKLLEESVSINH